MPYGNVVVLGNAWPVAYRAFRDRQTDIYYIRRTAMSVIHRFHSYEEPLIYVQDAFASRYLRESLQSVNEWWMKSDDAVIG